MLPRSPMSPPHPHTLKRHMTPGSAHQVSQTGDGSEGFALCRNEDGTLDEPEELEYIPNKIIPGWKLTTPMNKSNLLIAGRDHGILQGDDTLRGLPSAYMTRRSVRHAAMRDQERVMLARQRALETAGRRKAARNKAIERISVGAGKEIKWAGPDAHQRQLDSATRALHVRIRSKKKIIDESVQTNEVFSSIAEDDYERQFRIRNKNLRGVEPSQDASNFEEARRAQMRLHREAYLAYLSQHNEATRARLEQIEKRQVTSKSKGTTDQSEPLPGALPGGEGITTDKERLHRDQPEDQRDSTEPRKVKLNADILQALQSGLLAV